MESLGDRMKAYESSSRSYVDEKQPLVLRLDGHSFSKFTKGLKKPYEEWFHSIMVKVTAQLVKDYNAVVGYTQSDEITLVLVPTLHEEKYQPYLFNNQVQKIVSLAAANATNMFTLELLRLVNSSKIVAEDYKPQVYEKLATSRAYFDARVFNVPDLAECYNNLFWRSTYDCIRNSVSMAAQSLFSHSVLQKLSTKELKEKMKTDLNINWEDSDPEFKYGTFIKKRIVYKPKESFKKDEEKVEGQNAQKTVQKQQDIQEKDEEKEMVERKKLFAFTLHLPKYDVEPAAFLFSKVYQEENKDMKDRVCKEYYLE